MHGNQTLGNAQMVLVTLSLLFLLAATAGTGLIAAYALRKKQEKATTPDLLIEHGYKVRPKHKTH